MTVKAMDAVKSLEAHLSGTPGVWGVERSDNDGANWGGLPSPVTCGSVTGAWRPRTGDPGKWTAGRAGVGTDPIPEDYPDLRQANLE
jgi:hypothetical protein